MGWAIQMDFKCKEHMDFSKVSNLPKKPTNQIQKVLSASLVVEICLVSEKIKQVTLNNQINLFPFRTESISIPEIEARHSYRIQHNQFFCDTCYLSTLIA